MNDIKEYFYTDWNAMTQHDWLGLIITIIVFFIMIGLYGYIFHPTNKERLEALRHIPLDEDCIPLERKSERSSERSSAGNSEHSSDLVTAKGLETQP